MDFFGNNTTQEDATKQPNSFTDTFNAKVQELKDDRQQNFNRYGLEVSPEEYELLNEVTKTTQDPYRTATAYKISKEMDLPFQDVYSNLDSYVLPIVGTDKDKYTSENWYKSICDNFTIGTNNNKIGALGLKLMEAQYSGNTELADAILKEYQAIADYNNTLMQENAEYWGHDIIDAGMQSLPFTLPAMGLSLIPAVGPAASFVYSSATMSGMEYMDLKSQGVSDTTARNTAVIAGALEGIVEVTLGNVAGAIGAKMGESAAGEFLRRNAIDKITSKVAYKMHGSGKFRAIANLLGRTTLENLEEGAEEVVQESISIIASAIANEIDDTGYEGMTASEIARDLWENGKGGFLGSILLSSPTFMMNTRATVQDYKAVKSAAQDIPSKEVFVKAVADSPVFEGMSEEQKKQTASEIWESTDRRRKETAEMEEDAIAEVYSADESMETIEKEYDENGLEKEPNIPDVYRDNKGGLHFENTMTSDNQGVLSVGNPTKENANRYGRIEYTIDEDTNTVTIDQFKMSNHREDLRNDLFMDFAERFTGYNIEWNTKGKLAADIKEKLSDLNPQGKDKGLSFFNIEEDTTNSKARIEVARQIMANTNFSEKESIAAVGFFETLAKSLNKDVNTFLNENFGGKIFATEEQAEQSKKSFSEYKTNNVNSFINRGFTGENLTDFQKEQNAVISNLTAEEKKTIADYVNAENGLTSGVTKEQTEAIRKLIDIKPEAEEIIDYAEVLASQKMKGTQIQDGVRAAIYAGENADFSTWVHELAHVYRRALDGDKLYELEKAFGFDHGTWNREMEEQFAQSFEEYLRTGKAKNNQLKELFRQIADFIADVYKYLTSSVGGVKLNDDIIKVFDEIVSNEDSALAEAYQAVKEVQAENKEVQNVNEVSTKADSNKQEEQKAVTEEPAEVKPENEIAENTTLDDVTAEAVTSIISDESLSDTEKNGALVNAASEQRDFDIFQIIGEEGAKNLDQANEETIRMDNLNIAKEMETAGKDAKTIRLATGWEKGADGKWKYEIDETEFLWDKLKESNFNDKVLSLKDVLSENNELLKAYPSIGEYKIARARLGLTQTAGVDLNNKIILFKSGSAFDEYNENDWLTKTYKEDIAEAERLLKNGYSETELSNLAFYGEKPKSKEELQNEIDETKQKLDNHVNLIPESRKILSRTLSHEIQHLIQLEEGFAKGGTIGTVNGSVLAANINKAFNDTVKEIEDTEAFKEAFNRIADEYGRDRRGWKSYATFEAYKEVGFDYVEADEKRAEKVKYYTDEYSTYKAIAGEVESRNVETRMQLTAEERKEQLLADTEDVPRNAQIVLFQTAYHGTSADFDNFDLNYGMSGEGSMSFGYGVYVTGSEEIARDYAKRQQEEKSGKFIEDEISYDEKRIAEKEKELSDYVSFEEFKNKHEESINNLISKIEIRKQNGESTEFLENILKGKKTRNIEEDYENNKKAIEKDIEDYKKDIEENLAKIEKLKANGEAKRHLYTVDIPDNGFIKWDKNVRSSTVDKIGTALFRKLAYEPNEYGEYDYKGVENELKKELNDVFNSEYTGQSLYGTVSSYLGGDKQASEFLVSIGYNGIDYPAGTNFGNGKDIDARNYVIFKEKNAKILSNVLFQTSENDLIALAKEFENWTQFMEYCEDVVPKADVDKLTKNADTDWYRNLWEMANTEGVTTSQLEQEEYARQKALEEEDRLDPIIIDAVFKSNILKKPEMLDTFLQRIYDVQNTDLEQFRGTAEDWEEIGAPLEELQNRIRTSLKHGTWLSNAQRIQGGKQLTKEARNLMQKLIAHNLRQYRALYSLVMDDPYYAVRDDYITNLNEEGKKYGLNKDVENMSIEEMGRYADSISDKKLREKVRNGNVTIDELEDYVEDLDERTRNAEKKQKQNELEIQKAINDLSSSQEKTLLKLYGELIGVQAEMEIKKIPVPKEVKQTLKTIDYVNKPGAKLQARYEDLYKQYKDIEKAANVSGEAQALIKRIDLAKESKIEFKKLVKEQKAIDELKELRKKLVKRAMRKVSFDTVDYDTARAIIAVQQIFNSNLKNDVNEWIGKQGATAREIWSDYKTGTDEERKAMEKRFLRTQKTMDLFRKLRETNKAEELQDWAEKDIKALERLFTKSNWYKELQLDRLKEGRDNAIQLDIKEVLRGRATGYNADGSEYVTPVSMAEYSDEIAELVEDNLGSEILEKITYKPFNMWSISEMEDFVADLNNARRYGRDKLNAKKMREDMNAARLRDLILKQVRDTGIVINDDDSDKIKEKKQEKINKILGVSSSIKGTMDDHKTETRLNQILHGYMDANVRRVARILDNYSEGTVTQLLYWRENECFNVQERSKDKRISRIESLFNDNKVSVEDLYETREFDFGDGIKHVMSVDELLFFAQAERNNNAYDAEQQAMGIEEYEREEETSYEAVVYGNLMGADEKKRYIDQSRNFYDEIQKKQAEIVQAAGNGTEGVEKMQVELENLYTELKGVRESMKSECKRRMDIVLSEYYKVLAEKPGLAKLQDAIAKDYTDEFARINKASIEEFNQPVWREKWYLPLIRLELTGDTHEARVRADLLGNAAGTGKAGTEKGFTKKRIKIAPENQRPVETGLYKTWVDSVNRTEHFIAYASYVRELNRVFTNRDAAELKQSLQNRYGRPMTSYIDSYIKEVANPDRGEPTQGLDKLVRTLRGNVAPAYLAWKASSIIKQGLSSPAPFAQFINPIEYLNGAMALTHKETRDAINSKSAFMKNRVMDPMMDIIKDNELKAQSKAKHALKAFETTGMAGLEWIDYVCVAPGWYAIYKKAYNEGLKTQEARYQARVSELETLNESRSWKDKLPKENIMNQAMEEVLEDIEAEAVNKADDCVRLCQPSNRKTDLAPLFKNGNEIQKALLQFTTSLNVIWQNIRYDIPYAVRQKQFKDVVTMILGYAGAGLAMGLVCDGLGGDDEDEADKARKLVYYSTTQFTDSIPVLGAAITSASNRIITGEKGFMSNGTDLFPTFTKLKEGTFALTEGNIKKAAAKLSEGFALSTGLSVSATKELLYASGLTAEDKEIHPEAFVGRRED